MIVARINAYDAALGTLRRIYRVVAEDAALALALVEGDRATPTEWRLTVAMVRPAKEWDTPRIEAWTDVDDGKVAA